MIRLRLILADREDNLLDGLERLVEGDFDVVGRAHSLKQLIDMAKRRDADVVVVHDDLAKSVGLAPSGRHSQHTPGVGSETESTTAGATIVSMARAAGLSAKIVALTTSEDQDAAIDALQAGIDGYLLRRTAPRELLPALQEALLGNCWISPVIASKIIVSQAKSIKGGQGPENSAALSEEKKVARTLSPRQKKIVALIASGKIAKEVAADIGISRKTVEYHKYKVMKRLGLTSTAQLIRFAVRIGLDVKPLHVPE